MSSRILPFNADKARARHFSSTKSSTTLRPSCGDVDRRRAPPGAGDRATRVDVVSHASMVYEVTRQTLARH
jgi:hypothetical protein